MAGGGGERRGRRRSRGPAHPCRPPLKIDTEVDGMGAGAGLRIIGMNPRSEPMHGQEHQLHPRGFPLETDPKVHGNRVGSNLHFLGREMKGGLIRGQQGHRCIWWDRAGQHEVIQGVNFVPDSQDGDGDKFYYLPESDDEACRGESIDPEDDEVVLETEAQERQTMEDNGSGDRADLLSGAAKRLQKSSHDGALLVAGVADLAYNKILFFFTMWGCSGQKERAHVEFLPHVGLHAQEARHQTDVEVLH